MDKDELIKKIQHDFADLVNNSAIKTPEKAKQIAHALLQQGVQPTWRLIREVLGTGSAATLQQVVNNYWVEVGNRLNHLEKRVDIPKGLAKEFNKLWDKALKQANTEVEARLKEDFAEAHAVKEKVQQQFERLETEVEQLRAEKNHQEAHYAEDTKIQQAIIQQLKTQLEQLQQETKQLQKLQEKTESTRQYHQEQVTQLTAILATTKAEQQQITEQSRTEHQQVIARQAQQYESMIDHYANELGQLKSTHKKQGKQYQQERIEWLKQQEDTTQQYTRCQIDNAMLTQENRQLKKTESALQQSVESQHAIVLTLEKEKAALQVHCTFFEKNNTTLQAQLSQLTTPSGTGS